LKIHFTTRSLDKFLDSQKMPSDFATKPLHFFNQSAEVPGGVGELATGEGLPDMANE
jgi:hypothetical protein